MKLLFKILPLIFLLTFVSCNIPIEKQVEDIEIELVEENEIEKVMISEAQSFHETLKPIATYSCEKDIYPQKILKSYIELSTSYSKNKHYFWGFSYLELNKKKIQEYDSIIIYENEVIELIKLEDGNKISSLYESWGNINYSKKLNLVLAKKQFVDSLKYDTIYNNDNFFYEYLKSNYLATSQKTYGNGKGDGDYYEDSCTFIQEFDNQIVFLLNKCGRQYLKEVYLPKIKTETARKLMDVLFDLEWKAIDDTNVYNPKTDWISDTKHEPTEGEGAGCYYEIEQTENRTIIKNTYCGC